VLSGGGSSQVIPLGHRAADEFPVGTAVQVLPDGSKVKSAGTEIYDSPAPLDAIRAAAPTATVTYASGDNANAAADLARHADVAIVFAKQWMSEGRDVPDLRLPDNQDALIAAVADANPRTLVILETGGPVLMPWLDQVGAVLEAWYAGGGGPSAIARVLFGDVNPSGRLPITFPQAEAQLPRPTVPNSLARLAPFDIDYLEGADVGYRWFQLKNEKPLFPFGYGLSYTTFRIGGLQPLARDATSVAVSVTNTGSVEGAETVQVYAAAIGPQGPGTRRLIGWNKVKLRPNETKQVTIPLEVRPVAAFDEQRHAWMLGGDYLIGIGDSSSALPISTKITLTARMLPP
jgi:beta-glucosidase